MADTKPSGKPAGRIRGFREAWAHFKAGRPGDRCQAEYRRSRARPAKPWVRFGTQALGVALVALGVVALPAPGPGWLIIGLGGALLARQSPAVARFLDGAEIRGRRLGSEIKRWWTSGSRLSR